MPAKASVIQVEPDLAEAFNSASEQERERVKNAMRAVLKIVPSAPKKAHRSSKNESELFRGRASESGDRISEASQGSS